MELATLKQTKQGYTGELQTLTVRAKIEINAISERKSDKSPSHRITSGGQEIGAAWTRQSKAGAEYLSVRIDDPAFSNPIYAAVVTTKTGPALVWGR